MQQTPEDRRLMHLFVAFILVLAIAIAFLFFIHFFTGYQFVDFHSNLDAFWNHFQSFGDCLVKLLVFFEFPAILGQKR
jgi:hypothetical protein